MTHWGWYWRIKKQYTPKKLCSWYMTLDSFDMFNKAFFPHEMQLNQVAFEAPAFNLKLIYQSNQYYATFKGGAYHIPFENQPCNYGGVRYFFRCPECKLRARILYCVDGLFLCRKCHKLGYYSQRLLPLARYSYMAEKIEKKLQDRAGTLYRKPPWMKRKTHQALCSRHTEYNDIKPYEEMEKEIYDLRPKWSRRKKS